MAITKADRRSKDCMCIGVGLVGSARGEGDHVGVTGWGVLEESRGGRGEVAGGLGWSWKARGRSWGGLQGSGWW